MQKGQILELKIEDMTHEGQGIGKFEGFTVFVRDAVIGDTVKAKLTKVKKNYAFARVTEFIEKSENRTRPYCEYLGICGGCTLGTLNYDTQLEVKQKQVRDKLERLAGITNPKINKIIGMLPSEFFGDAPFRYRNKASMPVSTGGLITKKGGIIEPCHEPRVGFFKPKSHEVVDCGDCLLQSEPAIACAKALRQFMTEDHITSYDERWDKGLMRHLVVRTAVGTGEVMVILVINGKGIPNIQKLVDMLDDAVYNVPVYDEGVLKGVEFNLKSVVINVNNKKTPEIFGDECITVAGNPTIREVVETEDGDKLEFEISPLSFYQVNRIGMRKLYQKAIEYANLRGDETVLDLYCGVGTIGLFCAKEMQKNAKINGVTLGKVIGIESIKGAVSDANRNATINGIVNARYICGKAEEELPFMLGMTKLYKFNEVNEKVERISEIKIDKVDVIILDPPRSGCDERLLEGVIKSSPSRIVYVSCDPATLSRDIKYLTQNGYDFVEATPVDMFPHTTSIETVCLLIKAS